MEFPKIVIGKKTCCLGNQAKHGNLPQLLREMKQSHYFY